MVCVYQSMSKKGVGFIRKGGQLLAVGAILGALLSGCGGGSGGGSSGGSSGSSSGGSSSTTSNGVGSTTTNNNSVTGSTAYNASLVAFVDTMRGIRLLQGMAQVFAMTGNGTAVSCPGGGTGSYANPTLTMSLCQYYYSTGDAYTVSAQDAITTSGTSSTDNFGAFSMQVYDPANTTTPAGAITGGSFTATGPDANGGLALSNDNGLTGWFAATTNTYTLSGLNAKIFVTGGYLTSTMNSSVGNWFVVAHGGNTYNLWVPAALVEASTDPLHPQSGSYGINYTSTVGCSPITVNFPSATQFTLSCGGYTGTHAWTDADVVAAFAATN